MKAEAKERSRDLNKREAENNKTRRLILGEQKIENLFCQCLSSFCYLNF